MNMQTLKINHNYISAEKTERPVRSFRPSSWPQTVMVMMRLGRQASATMDQWMALFAQGTAQGDGNFREMLWYYFKNHATNIESWGVPVLVNFF